jgi:hypothetical protein
VQASRLPAHGAGQAAGTAQADVLTRAAAATKTCRAQSHEEQRTLSIVVDRALRAERARCAAHAARSDTERVDDHSLEVVRQE